MDYIVSIEGEIAGEDCSDVLRRLGHHLVLIADAEDGAVLPNPFEGARARIVVAQRFTPEQMIEAGLDDEPATRH